MATITTYPFTTAGNYTASDSDLIEVASGVGRLVDLVDADETFFASYTTNSTAIRSDGTAAPTTDESTVSGGVAVLAVDDTITYEGTSNLDMSGDFTIRMNIVPSWTGAPTSDVFMFQAINDSGNAHRIDLKVDEVASGRLLVTVYDAAGSLAVNTSALYSTWTATEQEVEWNISPSNGTVKMFIKGALVLDYSGSAWTSTSGTDNISINYATSSDAFDLSALQLFNTAKHSTTYTVEAASETQYSTAKPSLLTNSSFNGNISGFSAEETINGSDSITYAIQVGGTDYYWTGSAWATSSGFSQSNTESDIATNIPLLNTGNNAVKIKVYLHSNDGSTTPTVDSITVTYDAADTSATEPTLCLLEGFLYDHNGPVSGQVIEVRPALGFANEEIFVSHEWQTFATTGSDGYFGARIWESASQSKEWEFRIGTKKFRVQVPNATSAKFTDLTITAVTTS